VHGSDIETAVIRRLIDECPNVAAIKAEGGMPSIMGFVECYRLFGKGGRGHMPARGRHDRRLRNSRRSRSAAPATPNISGR
jgi:4-hydroxy-tetrahydrodipicolinate synthase